MITACQLHVYNLLCYPIHIQEDMFCPAFIRNALNDMLLQYTPVCLAWNYSNLHNVKPTVLLLFSQ